MRKTLSVISAVFLSANAAFAQDSSASREDICTDLTIEMARTSVMIDTFVSQIELFADGGNGHVRTSQHVAQMAEKFTRELEDMEEDYNSSCAPDSP